MTKHYKEVKAKADFVEIEKEVLKFWDEDKTFEKSVHNRDGAAEFVFYDGPPFANGTPHYDILWFLTLKTLSPVIRR